MDSSAAVFSTQGSPFLEASNFQSHYHPSRAQPLSQRERTMALSPPRLQQRNRPASPKEAETSSLPLLPDCSCQEAKLPDSDSASPYNESWPSTERSSSSLTPEEARALPPEQTSGTKALASPELQGSIASFSNSESVIARYIERFRYGQPTTRRERWTPGSKSPPFWWLGHSSPTEGDISKTETSTSSSASRKDVDAANSFIGTDLDPLGGRPSSFSPVLDHSPSGESQDSSTLDPETISLQERAARLLHRSMSPLSSCRHVSSEGLSSTPTSTIANADADLIGQAPKPLVGHHHKASLGALTCPAVQILPSCSSLRPEDDILFQWRLRRKMEEASKAVAVLPSIGWRSQYCEPAYPPSTMGGAALSPEPISWKSKDRTTLAASEAQLKSTLNEHPCCCRDRWRSGPSSQPPAEGASFSDQNVMLGHSEPNQKQSVKEPILKEDSVPVRLDCLPPPKLAGATRPLDLSSPDHSQKAAWPAQKVFSEPRGKQRPFRSEQSRPKAPRDSAKPSVSPGKHVQRVLGEVVTERLFSLPDSPAPQKGKLKRTSKKQGLEDSLPDTVATPSYPELLYVAAQLLEQAEDSDGTDFEEDPLLQVLRSQRDLLRRQLRAVDVRVAQLEGHHSNQDFSNP
ncbi:proline and serine-rich protein 3 [Heteronotia binoei]|uniref:proline and serine-rich protein 3 n=1 Tax=Heteronotia binoei TaxID=13085 RepID=UPI00292F0D1E|nr:proline and serine-rich protein 3 [Heteronotia binoei]XP_060113570.1 proline and serine-rich protein 3 [Heteronotia binoei]